MASTREEQEVAAREAFTAIGLAPNTVECVVGGGAGRVCVAGGERRARRLTAAACLPQPRPPCSPPFPFVSPPPFRNSLANKKFRAALMDVVTAADVAGGCEKGVGQLLYSTASKVKRERKKKGRGEVESGASGHRPCVRCLCAHRAPVHAAQGVRGCGVPVGGLPLVIGRGRPGAGAVRTGASERGRAGRPPPVQPPASDTQRLGDGRPLPIATPLVPVRTWSGPAPPPGALPSPPSSPALPACSALRARLREASAAAAAASMAASSASSSR